MSNIQKALTGLLKENPVEYQDVLLQLKNIRGLHIQNGMGELVALLKSYYEFRMSVPDFEIDSSKVIKEFTPLFKLLEGRVKSTNKQGRPSKSSDIILLLLSVTPFSEPFFNLCKKIEAEYPKRTIYSALHQIIDHESEI